MEQIKFPFSIEEVDEAYTKAVELTKTDQFNNETLVIFRNLMTGQITSDDLGFVADDEEILATAYKGTIKNYTNGKK